MPKNRRGRPTIRPGEPSTSLSVRVPNSEFDELCRRATRWGVPLPTVVRTKLSAVEISEEDIGWAMTQEAKEFRDEARAFLDDAVRCRRSAVDMLETMTLALRLMSSSRTDAELRSIAEHLVLFLTQKPE